MSLAIEWDVKKLFFLQKFKMGFKMAAKKGYGVEIYCTKQCYFRFIKWMYE